MPGSSNFQIWNPSSINQENDSQYTADTLRSGGATTGALLPSKTDNKFRYQNSTGVWALMKMMANKGFVVSDANASSLASVLSNILTTADQRSPLLTVTWSSSMVFDCSKADGFAVIMLGNITSLAILNASPGQRVVMEFIQGGSGGYTVAFPSAVRSPGTLIGTVGTHNIQQWFVSSDNNLRPIGPMTASF